MTDYISGDGAQGGFGVLPGAVSDLPAGEDLLGFAPLVEGVRALLNVRRTRLPLAIAITGPWGAGKSSLMLQLRQLLRDPGPRHPQERQWWTVDFPAWKYEHGERLWAALAKAVYEQPQEDMSCWERVRFRVRIEQERLGWRKFLLKGVGPPLGAAGAVSVAVAANVQPVVSDAVTVGVPSVAAFFAAAAYYWGVASKPFKRAIQGYVSAPDYDEKLGFTADADHDIRSLARVLAPDSEDDPRALAIFVDDLDRCASLHVVEVVEAMNQIFNSEGRGGCVFVLGLDREVVAANIEVAYSPTVAWLRQESRHMGRDFGLHFLAKLVQLSVSVPKPDAAATQRLLSSLQGEPPDRGEDTVAREDIERAENEIRQQLPEGLSLTSDGPIAVDASRTAIELGERRVRAERIQDSPEVIAAEVEVLKHLGNNPRQIKRFDNAFRLQLYVANEDPNCQLTFTLDELVALAKWVVLRLRWPELAEALKEEPWLLSALEAKADKTPVPISDDEMARLKDKYDDWRNDHEVLALLQSADGKEGQRLSSLQLGFFLEVI